MSFLIQWAVYLVAFVAGSAVAYVIALLMIKKGDQASRPDAPDDAPTLAAPVAPDAETLLFDAQAPESDLAATGSEAPESESDSHASESESSDSEIGVKW